jgi:hypothetical protein
VGCKFLDRNRTDELNKCLENNRKSACDYILLDYVRDFCGFYSHMFYFNKNKKIGYNEVDINTGNKSAVSSFGSAVSLFVFILPASVYHY